MGGVGIDVKKIDFHYFSETLAPPREHSQRECLIWCEYILKSQSI